MPCVTGTFRGKACGHLNPRSSTLDCGDFSTHGWKSNADRSISGVVRCAAGTFPPMSGKAPPAPQSSELCAVLRDFSTYEWKSPADRSICGVVRCAAGTFPLVGRKVLPTFALALIDS